MKIRCASQHDIDFSIFWDTDYSVFENESIMNHIHETGGGDNIYLYCCRNEDVSDFFEVKNIKDFMEIYYRYQYNSDDDTYQSFSKMREDVLDNDTVFSIIKKHISLPQIKILFSDKTITDWADVKTMIENVDDVLEYLPKEADDEIKKRTIEDALDIWGWDIFDTYDIENFTVEMKKEYDYLKDDNRIVIYEKRSIRPSELRDVMTEIPLSCRITVDDVDYILDGELKSGYNYDKDEIINVLKKQMGGKFDSDIEDYLKNNLPDFPECL